VQESTPMPAPLTADDLRPMIARLSHDEQVRLAKIALRAAAGSPDLDATACRTAPPGTDEFSSEDDPLAWEAEGWEGVDAPR
jgi:hypothetical protein